MVEGEEMSEWIKCSERMPPPNKPVIVYGKQMSSHWPDIAYAKWDAKDKSWTNCFAYGLEDYIRESEVDHWLEIPLPEGLHE
jgi:hypothetical protein